MIVSLYQNRCARILFSKFLILLVPSTRHSQAPTRREVSYLKSFSMSCLKLIEKTLFKMRVFMVHMLTSLALLAGEQQFPLPVSMQLPQKNLKSSLSQVPEYQILVLDRDILLLALLNQLEKKEKSIFSITYNKFLTSLYLISRKETFN